jgi:site-specific recombinase XerC
LQLIFRCRQIIVVSDPFLCRLHFWATFFACVWRRVCLSLGGARTVATGNATSATEGGWAMKTQATFSELLQAYFTQRLMHECNASPHTIANYRDAFRLLIGFAHRNLKKHPTVLAMQDLDASFVCRFLDHLEKDPGVSTRSRNVRLAAIHSFFHYVALQEPALGALAQRVLAIKSKRHIKRSIDFLTRKEAEALLAAPNQQTWSGRRDHALLLLALQTGLRLSEIIGLRCQDIVLDTGTHVRCIGKGRKSRCVPLRKETVAILRAWLRERNAQPGEALFPNVRGKSLSRDGVQYLLALLSGLETQ